MYRCVLGVERGATEEVGKVLPEGSGRRHMSANGPYVPVFTEASIPGRPGVSFSQDESAANAINAAPLTSAAGQPSSKSSIEPPINVLVSFLLLCCLLGFPGSSCPRENFECASMCAKLLQSRLTPCELHGL